jgi:hypothetical protein
MRSYATLTVLAFTFGTLALACSSSGDRADAADPGPATDVAEAEVLADVGPEPWPWPTCERLRGSSERLVDKTAYLDALVPAQHLGDRLLRTVREQPGGGLTLDHQPSTGLWTGIYLASQSFRYAVTGDPEAQANAAVAIAGLHDLTAVTGVPGLYGRAYQRAEGAYTYDAAGGSSWVASPAPGYEGWWYDDDVSKDTMDGIVFGYAVALEHLDDPDLLGALHDDVLGFVRPFVAHGLQILDADGQVTQHGRLYYSTVDDFPGFNALLSTSFVKTAVALGDDPDLAHFYDDCLLRLGDRSDCPVTDVLDLGSYLDVIEERLHAYRGACLTSYDNLDMVFHAIYPLLRRETRAPLAARLRAVLEFGIWQPADPDLAPAVHRSTHALYIALYGGLAEPAPTDPVFRAALDDAVCSLFELPRDRRDRDVAAGQQQAVCENRMGRPNAAEVIPLLERHFDNYVWRLDPYEIPEPHVAEPGLVYSPEDYLLAYWAARYHGLIPPDL